MKIIEIFNYHGMITISYDYKDLCMMKLWGSDDRETIRDSSLGIT